MGSLHSSPKQANSVLSLTAFMAAHQRSCGKIMFLHMFVGSQGNLCLGGLCLGGSMSGGLCLGRSLPRGSLSGGVGGGGALSKGISQMISFFPFIC